MGPRRRHGRRRITGEQRNQLLLDLVQPLVVGLRQRGANVLVADFNGVLRFGRQGLLLRRARYQGGASSEPRTSVQR